MVKAYPPMPLVHVTPHTQHATPASTAAGNVGKKSLGKEHDEEQAKRRD